MKSTDLRFLILKELAEFHEFRPSSDSWCSATSILKKLGVNDMEFSRSVMQNLIEEQLINHRGGEKLKEGGFELIIQPNKQGLDLLEQNKASQKTNNEPPNGNKQKNRTNLLNSPIGYVWLTAIGGVIAIIIVFLIRHHLGIPL